MFRIVKYLLIFAAALVAVSAVIAYSGNTLTVIAWLWGPSHGWDLTKKAPTPDYADAAMWAAWPGRESPAQFAPAGVANPVGERAVDVFFVHPTGYLNGGDWNSPMNPSSRTEENTRWMMANQASAFSSCCNIYAPRYREASLYRYLSAPPDVAEKTMDFAYADVVRAFEYYLANENKGRPFIIASHSQGTTHAFRLIKEKIDGTTLQARMVAAYLIGSRVRNTEANDLKSIKVCDGPMETGCLIHWATYGEGGIVRPDMQDLVCVNPLSWRRDGTRAEVELHQGGVAQSGVFSMKLWGDDAPQGTVFQPLGAPVPKVTWAECKDGILWVAEQTEPPFAALALPEKNYHGLDYPLFHMDIRKNVVERVSAYLQRALGDGPAAAK